MHKRMKTFCNICLSEPTKLKCSECTFECCYNCIYEWSEKSHNCPQCGKFETYDIEYSMFIQENDDDDDTVYNFELLDSEQFYFSDESSVYTYDPEEPESESESDLSPPPPLSPLLYPPPPPPPPHV